MRIRLALLSASLALAACPSNNIPPPNTGSTSASSGGPGSGASNASGASSTGTSSGSTSGTSGTSSSSSGGVVIPCGGPCPTDETCVNNRCVQCTVSSQCSASQPYCEGDSGVCAECLDSTDCDGGLCDRDTLACVPDCNIRDYCVDAGVNASGVATPYCEPDSGTCAACLSALQCHGGKVCLPFDPIGCVICQSNAECASDYPTMPYCSQNGGGTCAECRNDADCDGGQCVASVCH